jgi:hypothetical protein
MGTYQRFLTVLAALALPALAAPCLMAQGLTAEEVTAAMESNEVQGAFTSCAATSPHPESIDFVFIIAADGSATLTKTEPPVEAGLMGCFHSASAKIKLKATGKKFEITYPMEFAPYSPTPPAEGTVATTASGAVVVLPPSTPPTAAPPVAPPPPQTENPAYLPMYRSGNAMVISGAVLLGVGGAVFLGSLIGLGVVAVGCSVANAFLFSSDECDVPLIIPVMFFGGLAMLITGIVVLAVGVKRKRKAQQIRYSGLVPQVGFAPLSDGQGAMTALRWAF